MRIAVIVWVVLWSVAVLHAQVPAFKCSHLTRADGLVDNMISCVLQDHRGFLWFGSHRGLNRYDGYQMREFQHDTRDTHSLSGMAATCLYEDKSGVLWVATSDGGLNRLIAETETFMRCKYMPERRDAATQSSAVLMLTGDAEGNLWIMRDNARGVQKFNPRTGVWTIYTHDARNRLSLSSDAVTSLCSDRYGRIWVATLDGGLNRYDASAGGFINGYSDPSYAHRFVGRIDKIVATHSALLTACADGLLYSLQESKHELLRTAIALPGFHANNDNGVSCMLEDYSGTIWVGTLRSGLYRISPETRSVSVVQRSYTDVHSLSSLRIFALAQDSYGDIWIGTDAGVQRVHRSMAIVQHFQHNPLDQKSLSDSEIRAVYRSADGVLWLGTAGSGLNRSTASGFRTIAVHPDKNRLAENTINVLCPALGGKLWAGTNTGLYLFDPQRESFTAFGPFSNRSRVWALAQSGDSVLWVGVQSGGLTEINLKNGRARLYLCDSTAPHRGVSVLSLLEDNTVLWVGTTQGLYRMEKSTKFTTLYSHQPGDTLSISYNHVWGVYKTFDGRYWVGTSGGGLNMFDPTTGHFSAVTTRNGLPSNVVCGMLEDKSGALWVTTDNGLAVLRPSTGLWRTFGEDDGFFHSVFHFKSCFRDASGVMYAGGANGLLQFNPDSMAWAERPALLLLTDFKIYDRSVKLDTVISIKKQVELDYRSNFFSVEFALVDFAGTQHHRYRYRLEGYDRQWQHTDGRRPVAVYTDVPPGTYTLVVQHANASGEWNARSAFLSVVVRPAWWQTAWFRVVLTAVFVLCIVAVVARTMSNIQRKSTMERRLVESQLQALRAQMNPHFIFNSLNSIYFYIMSHDSNKAQKYLLLFSLLLRQILEYSRKTFVPVAREIELLQMYLELETMRFSQRFRYKVAVDTDIDMETQLIPTMLLQPYVENAIKHGLLPKESDCLLSIDFRRNGDSMVCCITDNGIGRKMAQQLREQSQLQHESRGLELSRERLESLSALHGRLYGVEVHDLTTDTGEALGTQIVLTFPLGVADIGTAPPRKGLRRLLHAARHRYRSVRRSTPQH